VVRIADRIAYINHDIDDAIRAGVISEDQLPEECTDVLGRGHSERIATMVTDLASSSRGKPELCMSRQVLEAMDTLKDFLFERVYGPGAKGSGVEELRKAGRLVRELFRYFMEHPEILPEWCSKETAETAGRARVVCDFIAGMTDRYAQRRYSQYFLPESMAEL
jgi:dGTPase